MSENFGRKLAFLIAETFGPNCKDKTLASALSIDRSTVNRLRHSVHLPGQAKLEALSQYFGVSSDIWELSDEDFGARARQHAGNGHDHALQQRCVSMSAITAHRHRWNECFAKHQGQYIAYWKSSDATEAYVASLLEITRVERAGLQFNLINPYIRDDAEGDEHRIWQYEGVCYPVADYLYFFGEQVANSYELFTMVMTASPIAPPDILRGCMLGIHVKDGTKQIATNTAVVLLFVRKPVADWRRELGMRLGKLPAGKVPERVRRIIQPFPGVLPIGV